MAELDHDQAPMQTALRHAADTDGVTVVNFSHPLTAAQITALKDLLGLTVGQVVGVPTHCEMDRPFSEQAVKLVDGTGLTAEDWQSLRLVIVPPALTSIACLVIAEIHGRAGYFVPVVRLRPRAGTVPPVFEVAEMLDVQGQRDAARARR